MEIKVIAHFDNYVSANMILAKLQNEGIFCRLMDEYTNTINPIFGNVIGGIKLVVKENDVPAANRWLAQFKEEFMKTVVCPKCGLNEIEIITTNTPANIATKIFTWLISSYALSAESVYQCQACGYISKTLPEDVESIFAK